MFKDEIIINIANSKYDVKFFCDSLCEIIINNKPYKVELLKKYRDNIFTFVVNQKLMQVEIDFNDDSTISINYNGIIYEIEISDTTKQMLDKFIKNSSKEGKSGIHTIKAPMPGMIVKSYVEPGVMVLPGDRLLVVEAMKMENVLKSPVAGTIKEIHISPGTAIEKNAPLIDIDIK